MSKYNITDPLTVGNEMSEVTDSVVEALTIALTTGLQQLGHDDLQSFLDSPDNWINVGFTVAGDSFAACRTIGGCEYH